MYIFAYSQCISVSVMTTLTLCQAHSKLYKREHDGQIFDGLFSNVTFTVGCRM